MDGFNFLNNHGGAPDASATDDFDFSNLDVDELLDDGGYQPSTAEPSAAQLFTLQPSSAQTDDNAMDLTSVGDLTGATGDDDIKMVDQQEDDSDDEKFAGMDVLNSNSSAASGHFGRLNEDPDTAVNRVE